MKNLYSLVVSTLGLGILPGSLVFAQPGPATYPANMKPTYADLAYANVSKSQVLDLFLPSGSGPFPLVINIHGGGFMLGSKEMLDASIAQALLEAGVAVASINYRLSGEAKFPAAVQDVKAAVRFFRANASQYKLNPDKFMAFGQSAGGNLASMLGTSSGIAMFEDDKLGNAGISSRVQGVIDWFGPSDFLQMDAQAKAQGCGAVDQTHGQANSPETRYLGLSKLTDNPELVARANPIGYIDKSDPPFLLQKGDQDCTVPFGQSQLLYNALKAAGVSATFETIKGAGHGGGLFLSETNVKRVVDFVKATFR